MILIDKRDIGIKYIGAERASIRAGISRARFNELRRSGKAPSPVFIGRIGKNKMTLFDVHDVDAWIANREPLCMQHTYTLSPAAMEQRNRLLAHAKNLAFIDEIRKAAKRRINDAHVIYHILALKIPVHG